MWSLLVAAAWAAPVEVRVAGVGDATAVNVLLRSIGADGSPDPGTTATSCNDAALAPDAAVDGVWTCAAVDLPGASADVYAIVGTTLLPAGRLTFPAGARLAALRVDGGAVTASLDPGGLPTRPDARPAGPLPVIVARVTHPPAGQAPVLQLRGGAAAELTCRDDGKFPDLTLNDGEPGCAGLFPPAQAQITLSTGPGAGEAAGQVTWDTSPVRYLTVDGTTKAASTDPFPLPLPAVAAPAATATAGASTTNPSGATSPDARPAGSPEPQGLAPAGTSGGHAPPAAANPDPWLTGLPWLVGAALGVGGTLAWQRRQRRATRLPASIKPVAGAPLFPGGPTWADAGAILRTRDVPGVSTALLRAVAPHRRVLWVGPAPEAVAGPGVWYASVPDWQEVAAGARELDRLGGPAVAVLIAGEAALLDPGAVAPDALRNLARALPAGVWLGVVVASDAAVASSMPEWIVDGPPWRAERR